MCYAVIDEYLQTFLAGRHGNLIDVLIDFTGIIITIVIIYLISLKRKKIRTAESFE